MRPVKIIIPGCYWDTQIYSGDLYLFSEEASLIRVYWRTLVNNLADSNQDLQTALRVGFIDGDLFYNEKVRKILRDPSIDKTIRDQLDSLSSRTLEVAVGAQVGAVEIASPFDFAPTDTDVYYGTILAAGDAGLFSCRTSRFHSRRTRVVPYKHHDAAFLQIKSSSRNTAVAGAAGAYGLFEFAFDSKNQVDALTSERLLSPRSCKACDWSFESVLGWSETSAFLAKFKEEKYQNEKVRLFDRIVDVEEIFRDADASNAQGPSYSWGAREKLYRVENGQIQVVDIGDGDRRSGSRVKHDDDGPQFRGVIQTSFSEEEVISTGTAPFGTVIELPDRLVVMRSDSLVDEFPGEPVHWRIFPRSDLYSNQLHIIYDDRVEIVSFVHDYFVDQSEKISGFARGAADLKSELLF
ncbi:hypothetical protein [Dyella subtropica]|uniref:hypothetical protein n=1 Tax=Dyella subtropica TaxID=2992127 RepID=UPI0022512D85|nr:hypothetical protein [Dyella subtropica]